MAVSTEKLLEAGVHFGHLTSKWNPKMAPYIFMEQNGIHIIDLNKTSSKLEEAKHAIQNIARTGRKVMFVATKKQAKEILEENARRVNMPFVSQRWLGGMLTNFATVRKSIKKMQAIEKMKTDGTFDNMNKKERLMKTREQEKLARVLGGIENLNRIPSRIYSFNYLGKRFKAIGLSSFLLSRKSFNVKIISKIILCLNSFYGIVDSNQSR